MGKEAKFMIFVEIISLCLKDCSNCGSPTIFGVCVVAFQALNESAVCMKTMLDKRVRFFSNGQEIYKDMTK